MSKITKDIILSKLLKLPEAEKILAKYNLPCLGCSFAQYEMKSLKLGEVCSMYGIDIEKLLEEINSLLDPSS